MIPSGDKIDASLPNSSKVRVVLSAFAPTMVSPSELKIVAVASDWLPFGTINPTWVSFELAAGDIAAWNPAASWMEQRNPAISY
jgi:hypothetical protein